LAFVIRERQIEKNELKGKDLVESLGKVRETRGLGNADDWVREG
jgi:hypothetical protein